MLYMPLFYRLLKVCALLAVFSLLFWMLGYGLIYKRMMRGVKRFSAFHVLKIIVLFLYIFAVLYVTILDRTLVVTSEGIHFTGGTEMSWNLIPLRDFIFHQDHGLLVPVRYALLNTVMFIPLGLLLPLVSGRFYKGKHVLFCGALFSLLIESSQLLCQVGIFEFDDLLFNTLGAAVGWLLFRLVFLLFDLPVKSQHNPGKFLA